MFCLICGRLSEFNDYQIKNTESPKADAAPELNPERHQVSFFH
jgi:hypothetical protein